MGRILKGWTLCQLYLSNCSEKYNFPSFSGNYDNQTDRPTNQMTNGQLYIVSRVKVDS